MPNQSPFFVSSEILTGINQSTKELTPQRHTWELAAVFLHVVKNVGISTDDDEPVFEDLNNCSNVEVLRSIEFRFVWRCSWLGHSCPFQELATNDSRVSDRRFIDGHHVISQTVSQDEPTTFVLWPDGILDSCKKQNI